MYKMAIILTATTIFLNGCYTSNRPFDTMEGVGQLIAIKTSALERPHYAWDICVKPVLLPDGRPMPAPPPTLEEIARKKPIFPFVCAQEEFLPVDNNGTVIGQVLGPLKDITGDLNMSVPLPTPH